jgi:hypothetical protein
MCRIVSVGIVAAAVVAASCSLIVDVGDLAREDGDRADADGDGHVADGDGGADGDVGPDAADGDGDADGDDGAEDASAPCSDGWLDPATGLCWENPPSGILVAWVAAATYCEDLSSGSGLPWRLPAIDELRTLVRGCPGTETGGPCGVSSTCPSSATCFDVSACASCPSRAGPGPGGCYWPDEFGTAACGWYWSSIPAPDRPGWTWGLGFDNAAIYLSEQTCTTCWVRCVRAAGP